LAYRKDPPVYNPRCGFGVNWTRHVHQQRSLNSGSCRETKLFMLLIDTIIADLRAAPECKRIRPFDLRELGYGFSKERIPLNTAYEIREVLDGDTKRSATFSFLLSRSCCWGTVLAKDYEHYLEIASVESGKPATETWKDSYTVTREESDGNTIPPKEKPAKKKRGKRKDSK
jgi:hypothetical protein